MSVLGVGGWGICTVWGFSLTDLLEVQKKLCFGILRGALFDILRCSMFIDLKCATMIKLHCNMKSDEAQVKLRSNEVRWGHNVHDSQ